MEMKDKMKFAIKLVCAGILGLGVICTIDQVTRFKAPKVISAINNGKKLDVAFFGGSHGSAAVVPDIIDKYGIESYNFCTGGQPLYLSYYWIKEIDKYYDMNTIVLDVYYSGLNQKYFFEESYVRNVVDNIPYSKNKRDMINACAEGDKLSYYFPLLKYHNRWKELTEQDFSMGKLKQENPYRGFDNTDETEYGQELDESEKTEMCGEIPLRSKEYLDKIIEYAECSNIELVFVTYPHQYKMYGETKEWVYNEYPLFNSIRKLAEENHIEFLEFNDVLDETEFIFPEDMKNDGHVNVGGAEKVSNYLGNYLKNRQ